MAQVTTDMPSSHQEQHSSDNNNGNDRSLASTGVGTQEKVPITALLEMLASRLGVLVCGWVVLVLVQGGIMPTVETKDRVFITVLFFLVCFRCWRYFYPQDTGYRTLSEATQSLPADDNQQLGLRIGFISGLFYWWNLFSAMTCVVLSSMRLVSQDFGQTDEVAKKVARDFYLDVFYGLTLVEALVLFFALTIVKIMAMLRTVRGKLIEWATRSQPASPTLSQPASPTLSHPAPLAPPTLFHPAPLEPPRLMKPMRAIGRAQSMGRAEMAEAQSMGRAQMRPMRARAEMGEAQMDRTQMGEAQMPEKVIPRRRRLLARRLEHGDPEGGAAVPKDL